MAEPWIGPRQERWTDYLPDSWQTAINTSPVVNALARYMNRPSFEEGVKQWQDSIPGNSPIDRIADRKSTLAQEFPTPMNPLGQSLMETGGFLANFIGPGAKMPPASAPKPQGIRPTAQPNASGVINEQFRMPRLSDGRPDYSTFLRGLGESYHGATIIDPAGNVLFNPIRDRSGVGGAAVWLQPDGSYKKGLIAYHGSPHDFEKFDISKIGTGEGAQAYGRGLYFAEREGVARSYRDALTEGTVKVGNRYIPTAESLKGASPRYLEVYDNLTLAEKLLSDYNGNFDRAIRDALELAKITRAKPNDPWLKTPAEQYEAAAAQLQQMRTGEWAEPHKGRMYEVRINADPEQFLDWDKPLAQQPATVRQVLEKFDPAVEHYNTPDQPISKWRETMGSKDARVESALRDAGIPGIRYKDQMSRGTDGGTYNYVVFDDALIEILRKYGLIPPVAAGAAQALTQGQDTAY